MLLEVGFKIYILDSFFFVVDGIEMILIVSLDLED